jgi:integrase
VAIIAFHDVSALQPARLFYCLQSIGYWIYYFLPFHGKPTNERLHEGLQIFAATPNREGEIMRFTDKMIVNLKPALKQYYMREAEGFAIRVLPSGMKAWLFIYVMAGKRRQMNLGDYPDVTLANARGRLTDARKALKDGLDPQEVGFEWHKNPEREKREAAKKIAEELKNPTVAILIDDYLDKHAKKKKKSWKEDERILKKDILPVWGDRKAKEIARRDVLRLLDGMQGRGNGIITNTFKIIRRMFRFAVKQEIISTTPCYAFEKGEELPRPVAKERNLTSDEIKAFWTGLDRAAISMEICNIMKLILLTGQRPGEVATMHRSEIDGRWWEFTPKETVITKETPRKQRIYLSNLAMELIGAEADYIFPSPTIKKDDAGEPIPTPITERAVAYALRRNLKTHSVKQRPSIKAIDKLTRKKPFIVPDYKKLTIEKFTPHDLRRTCATHISELGFSDAVVDALLAHLKKGEIRTYNKNKYDKEKQAAMEAWERILNCIIAGEDAKKVVSIHGRGLKVA